MPIPAFTPSPQNEPLRDEIKAALGAVVDSGQFVGGRTVEAFEEAFARHLGAEHAVGVSSGTDALLVSFMALGIGPGDQVLTTPFTFFATAGAIVRLGARPVFCDIDPQSFLLDLEQAAGMLRRVGPVKALVPVHLFGRCADLGAWRALAEEHGAALVEDTAQAIGARHGGRAAGTVGEFGCFSFYPTKNLGGLGDAGLVLCRRAEDAALLRSLRNHGQAAAYEHPLVGGNFRLDALQAAGLGVKLPHVTRWNAERVALADRYDAAFAERDLLGPVGIPERGAPGEHVFHQYVIRARDRDALRSHLAEQGIGSSVFYPVPLHLQPCFAVDPLPRLPVAEQACREVLALPMYPGLTPEQVDEVVAAIAGFYRG